MNEQVRIGFAGGMVTLTSENKGDNNNTICIETNAPVRRTTVGEMTIQPCMHCGASPQITERYDSAGPWAHGQPFAWYRAVCPECLLSADWAPHRRLAEADWNRMCAPVNATKALTDAVKSMSESQLLRITEAFEPLPKK